MSSPNSANSAVPGIEVTGLGRSFGTVHAVRDMTFTAVPGRVTALIGPNGSGKTTLMLMLASLLAPERGTIRVAGHDPLTDAAGVRASMGWMPDVLGSWASLTTRTTLEMTGRLHRMTRPAAKARAAALIERVGLDDLADRPTRVLSRGQKQRLSLARALVHDPQVLLLDEPASGLDPAARIDLRGLVRDLAAEGRTVLVSSHVLAELEEMADDAVFVEAGSTVSTERLAAAAASGIQWRFKTVDGAPPPDLPGLALTADRGAWLVTVTDEAAAAELLKRIVDAGVPIASFAPAVSELERTFVALGKEEGR